MLPIKVDFKYIRQNADFESVLSHYGLDVNKDGHKEGQFKALCPFHDDTKPSLKVNTVRNIYHCFACDAGGNILEFVQEMENENLRKSAITLAEICGIGTAESAKVRKPAKRKKAKAKKAKKKRDRIEQREPVSENVSEGKEDAPVNEPLTFELKNLETDHSFFEERGITQGMMEVFGLGISTRGLMKDRMAIPIHNANGELIAYCGRWPSNNTPESEPKYKLPSGFHKEIELFNLHRIDKPIETIVLVESYLSIFRLHMLKWPVASPMGHSLSEAQIALLKEAGVKNIILLFDGDDPGRSAVTKVGRQLLEVGFVVTAPVVHEDFKPHRLDDDGIRALLKDL